MKSALSKSIAQNVVYLRKERGLSQQQLSAVCKIPRTTLANIESGVGNPTIIVLNQVAQGLRVSVEELIANVNPECNLYKSYELAKQKRGHVGVFVTNLLPKPIPGVQVERIELAQNSAMAGTPHLKGTKEYFTCIEGAISVAVDGQVYVVEMGDVLNFPGDRKHSYKNASTGKSSGISLIVLE